MDEIPSSEHQTTGAKVVHCAFCAKDVEPAGKGQCPQCGRLLPGHTAALIHGAARHLTPAQLADRTALIEHLFKERGGRDRMDIVKQVRVEDYATAVVQLRLVAARLEEVGPLTERGRRRALVDVYNMLSARADRLGQDLDAPTGSSPSSTSAGLEKMPVSALELGKALLSRQSKGEVLTEREQGILEFLRGAMRGRVELPPDVEPVPSPDPTEPAAPACEDARRLPGAGPPLPVRLRHPRALCRSKSDQPGDVASSPRSRPERSRPTVCGSDRRHDASNRETVPLVVGGRTHAIRIQERQRPGLLLEHQPELSVPGVQGPTHCAPTRGDRALARPSARQRDEHVSRHGINSVPRTGCGAEDRVGMARLLGPADPGLRQRPGRAGRPLCPASAGTGRSRPLLDSAYDPFGVPADPFAINLAIKQVNKEK